MPRCDTCGNEYANSMQLSIAGQNFTFDCFECAIHRVAPRCASCGCKILGHGIEAGSAYYCCAHCARQHGHAASGHASPPETTT